MHSVTSFHSSDVTSQQLAAIMAQYLALERARVYRRLFITRCGLAALAVALIGFGFRWLPAAASWVGVGSFLVAPVWAWVAELKCDWRLERLLDEIGADAREIVLPPVV
jgi:hypothetical protein